MDWWDRGCLPWEYEEFGAADELLFERSELLVLEMRDGVRIILSDGCDSRAVHSALFKGLTPTGYEYYAGNYRGSEFRCSKTYPVGVPADPRVGLAPELVSLHMDALADWLRHAVARLDAQLSSPGSQISPDEQLVSQVVVAARLFRDFLTIHPYANGNGHISRFLVWLLLGRYGRWPGRWTVHPQPLLPGYDYSDAISAARDERPEALEVLILQSILA